MNNITRSFGGRTGALLFLVQPPQLLEDDLELGLIDLRPWDFDVVAAHERNVRRFGKEIYLFVSDGLGAAGKHVRPILGAAPC